MKGLALTIKSEFKISRIVCLLVFLAFGIALLLILSTNIIFGLQMAVFPVIIMTWALCRVYKENRWKMYGFSSDGITFDDGEYRLFVSDNEITKISHYPKFIIVYFTGDGIRKQIVMHTGTKTKSGVDFLQSTFSEKIRGRR